MSQITQLTNLISTKVNQDDYKSAITQLGDDINARVQKGDLISQINLEAGQTLIESKKLFLDADSVVFSGKAFIPDAAIANLSLDKLTTGHITIPLLINLETRLNLVVRESKFLRYIRVLIERIRTHQLIPLILQLVQTTQIIMLFTPLL